ncbi:hypothetical protein BLGI_4152 [Brevibacillus laterosporus GI-9]|nr:hypothetical protein BLGI_4152 [Brevibacillus laterosporus GI-9]
MPNNVICFFSTDLSTVKTAFSTEKKPQIRDLWTEHHCYPHYPQRY